MKIKQLAFLPLFAILAGCTTHKILTYSYITTDSAPVKVGNKNAQAQLAETSTTVGHSLQQMSAIDKATHPKTKLSAPLNPATIGMTQQTSLNWNGPIENLLQRVAKASHYKVRVIGKQPAVPVLVAINVKNVPLADILRNATYQVEKKADIKIYPGTKTIELRYHSV